jgi:hypothetical protein
MTTKSVPNSSDRPPSLGRHREMIGLATLAIVLAFSLQVRPDERVAFRGLSEYPLPHTCASRVWFKVDCPACGLTRSMIHLSRGEWAASTRVHRLGPLFAAALLLQFPYRFYGLRRRDPEPIGRLLPSVFGYFLIIALIGNWLYNQRPTAPASPSDARPVTNPLSAPARPGRTTQIVPRSRKTSSKRTHVTIPGLQMRSPLEMTPSRWRRVMSALLTGPCRFSAADS